MTTANSRTVRTLTVIFFAALVALNVTGCGGKSNPEKEGAAVSRAMLTLDAINHFSSKESDEIGQMVAFLKAIDVRSCPADFRNDFNAALSRVTTWRDKVKSGKLAFNEGQPPEPIREAFAKLHSTAEKYRGHDWTR